MALCLFKFRHERGFTSLRRLGPGGSGPLHPVLGSDSRQAQRDSKNCANHPRITSNGRDVPQMRCHHDGLGRWKGGDERAQDDHRRRWLVSSPFPFSPRLFSGHHRPFLSSPPPPPPPSGRLWASCPTALTLIIQPLILRYPVSFRSSLLLPCLTRHFSSVFLLSTEADRVSPISRPTYAPSGLFPLDFSLPFIDLQLSVVEGHFFNAWKEMTSLCCDRVSNAASIFIPAR